MCDVIGCITAVGNREERSVSVNSIKSIMLSLDSASFDWSQNNEP